MKRRSRTTYRPTVTPKGSTHVDIAFTDTTSSVFSTARENVTRGAVMVQPVFGPLAVRSIDTP